MKKIISLLVVLAMLMSMAPAVFAAEAEYQEVTIAEAIELATAAGADYTAEMYLVTGKITKIDNFIYGNMYIEDDNGDQLYLYGVYDVLGENRFDAMDPKPAVGDTITILGKLGTYTNANDETTIQMKNGWIQELVPGEPSEEPEEPVEGPAVELVEAPEAGVAYKFGMIQKNVSATDVYYLAGGMNGYYMDTTTDAAMAIDVYLEETEGGYYMYTLIDGVETYINMVVNGTHVNGVYEDTGYTVYTWDAESKTMVADINDELYWFGTRNDKSYTTVGPCKTEYNGFYCQFYAEVEEEQPQEGSLVLGNNELNAGYDWTPELTEGEFVAPQTGTLYITFRAFYMGSEPTFNQWLLESTYWVQLKVNGEFITGREMKLEVNAGDIVTISLESLDGDSYHAWFNLSYDGFYEEIYGSVLNPVVLKPSECPTTTITIPAGEEIYYTLNNQDYEDVFTNDHILYVYGEDAYIVTSEYDYDFGDWLDKRIDAVGGVVTYVVGMYDIRIGNAGTEDATFELDTEVPLGASANPHEIKDGEHLINMLEGNSGYYFEGYAPVSGTLSVTVTGDSYWEFSLQNQGDPEDWSDNQWDYLSELSDEGNTLTIDVEEGDYIFMTLRLQDEDYNTFNGSLTVTFEYAEAGSEGPGEGNEEEPTEITFEMNETYTVGTATVTVPAGTTAYYSAYGIGGMVLTVTDAQGNVVKTELLAGNPRMPVAFEVTNDTDAEQTYTLTVTFPAGTFDNPEELEMGYTSAVVGAEGHFYTWTATEDTLLAISMQSTNWTYCINIENADGYRYGDTRFSDDENPIYMSIIEVKAGDIVTIVVGTADWTEDEVSFSAATYAAGEPIEINFVWNEQYTAAAINVDMPAGEYTFTMWNGAGMQLTVDGVVTEMTGDGWFDPILFNVSVAEAGIVAMELSYPAGTYYNPEELQLGYNSAEIEEYSMQGYWYTFTATEDCLFVLSMMSDNWSYSAMIQRADGSYGYPDGYYSAEEVVVPMQILDLKAGDVVLLNFGTADYAAATVEFTAATYAVGAPIEITFMWNEQYTAAAINVDMPAGEYTFNMWNGSGMQLTVDGVVTEMTGDGWFDPIMFNVSVAEAGVVAMELSYPTGTYYNPEELQLGENAAEIEEFSQQGYWYTFTATEDCLFVLNMVSDNWFYSAMIQRADGSFGYPDGHYSAEDVVVPVQVLDLKAGDMLLLNFGTSDYAAATVEFVAMTYAGTEEDPVMLEFVWNEDWTAATLNADLPAGEFVYGAYIAGTILTVNGVETEYVPGGWRTPCLFTINNTATTNTVFNLGLTYPLGTFDNPDLIEGEGNFTVEVNEDSEGYFLNWIAEEDGTLTVTMVTETNWYFTVNNVTAGIYGDAHWSDDEPLVTTVTIDVTAGDVIEIIVNTYVPENFAHPAGELTITLEFNAAEADVLMGDVNGDGKVDTTDAKLIMQLDLGIITEADLNVAAADVNGDGKIDTTDAKLIMQLDLGIITEFPKNN